MYFSQFFNLIKSKDNSLLLLLIFLIGFIILEKMFIDQWLTVSFFIAVLATFQNFPELVLIIRSLLGLLLLQKHYSSGMLTCLMSNFGSLWDSTDRSRLNNRRQLLVFTDLVEIMNEWPLLSVEQFSYCCDPFIVSSSPLFQEEDPMLLPGLSNHFQFCL